MPDVNVLVYAHREDTALHEACLAWLQGVVDDETPCALAELVLSGFLRIVTHPRIFGRPSTLEEALTFLNQLRDCETMVPALPGPGHWDIFVRLCRAASVKGSLVADAYLAALAMEQRAEWVTTDRDFARFPGLRWRHPLDPPA